MRKGPSTPNTAKTFALLASLGLAALLTGCGETGVLTLLDPVDSTKERIVNGQVIPLTDHPAVGKLTHSGSLCTATLIGKKTVVTASHCVSPGSTHYFEVGGTKYQAAWAKRHPQYGSGYSNDIAIVMLNEAPPVEPAMMNITPVAQGLELTIVGFGKTGEWSNDAGTKRKTQNTASSVTSTHISFQGASGSVGNICNGDSGGPSFATVGGHYVQVGVHSTKSGSCGSGGNDIRIDAYQDWVEQTAGGDVVKPGSTPSNPPTNPSNPPDPSNPPGGTQPGDTSAPQVAITAPAALADVAPQVSVKTAINDDVAVTKVELHIGDTLAATLTAPPYDFAVTLPAGPQTIRIYAFDAAGNKGEASVAVTVVDGSAPPTTPPTTPPTNPGPATGAFGASLRGPGRLPQQPLRGRSADRREVLHGGLQQRRALPPERHLLQHAGSAAAGLWCAAECAERSPAPLDAPGKRRWPWDAW